VERGYIDHSPCLGLRSPSKHVSRDRVLTEEELRAVWKAAADMGYPYGNLVQLLILTAQRRDEVANLRWTELDLEGCLWELPAERNKSKRSHVVPLGPLTCEIIDRLPKVHATLVFPARGTDNPISGFSKWKRELDARSRVTGWRIHDLRRTTATGLARLKVPAQAIERLLNHSSGILGGVAGVYNRFDYLPEVRGALELWERHIGALAQIQKARIQLHKLTT